jgi:hypothetical protein
MNANQLERAAYIAAHAILAANTGAPELACPGARRSHTVDTIADINIGVFELHSSALDGYIDWQGLAAERKGTQAVVPISPRAWSR